MAFEAEPLEDGIDHPAERIIDDALRSVHGRRVLAWFRALSVDVERPGLAASILRCLGRRRPGTSAWRVEIVRSALAADDVEMRDAAVQAAESWGDPGNTRGALEPHGGATLASRLYRGRGRGPWRVDSGNVPGPKDRSRQMGCETEY